MRPRPLGGFAPPPARPAMESPRPDPRGRRPLGRTTAPATVWLPLEVYDAYCALAAAHGVTLHRIVVQVLTKAISRYKKPPDAP